jgi:pimeloyl-ACP methyl ester carboxylesterase
MNQTGSARRKHENTYPTIRNFKHEKKKLYPVVHFAMAPFQIATPVSASSAVRPAGTGRLGIFEPAPCPIAAPEGVVEGKDILCGYVTVPERHAKPNGATLRLAVARLPGSSGASAADPVVLLAGGPGESNFQAFIPGMGTPVGERLRAGHDIVVIELRGLLYSQPNLLCPERFDVQEAQLDEDPDSIRAITEDQNAIRACHDRLLGQGIDLAAFNNVESAADIALVMTALGYDQFDLYGNSAGTLLAQHVMRAYPQRLRAVALGSLVPLSVSTWPAMPANGTRALQRVFETCAADPACHRAYPALEADFPALIDRLNRRPVRLSLEDPAAQGTFQLLLTGNRTAQWIYNLLLTDANSGPSIPFIISRLTLGDYRPLEMGAAFFLPARSFSQGLQYSVACAEKGQFSPDAIDLSGPYPAFAKAVSALPFGPERLLAACKIWDVPYLGASVNDAVAGDVPTLLLAGDLDPGIPPSYSQAVARPRSRVYAYDFPGVAHSPIDGGACPLSIALAFLDEPTNAPDSTCISDMRTLFVSEPMPSGDAVGTGRVGNCRMAPPPDFQSAGAARPPGPPVCGHCLCAQSGLLADRHRVQPNADHLRLSPGFTGGDAHAAAFLPAIGRYGVVRIPGLEGF